MGVGVLLILIAAANVANLLLFRSVARRGEVGMQRALGASAGGLVRQQLVEGLMLSTAGGGVGVLLALLLTPSLAEFTIPGIGLLTGVIDWRVLALTLAVSAVVGLVFSLLPALLAARGDLMETLRGAGQGSRRGVRLRSSLTVVQLALSLTLLVGALLFVTTLRNLHRVDPGFDSSNVTAMFIDLRSHGYSNAEALVYYRALLDRVGALPGVQAATVSERPPFGGATSFLSVYRPGDDSKRALQVPMNGVSSGYFATLGIAFVRGHPFSEQETYAPYVGPSSPVIVSEALAGRLFGEADPIGRSIATPRNAMSEAREYRIIGVTRHVRWNSLEGEPDLLVYQPLGLANFGVANGTVMVRSPLPSGQIAALVQSAASNIDASVPVYRDRPLSAFIKQWLVEREVFGRVLGLLALLGFTLAAVGLHGLVGQTVAERRREFGIRMALGASTRDILALISRQAAVVALLGTAMGVAMAAAGSQVIESRLFGVQPLEPVIYITAAMALALVVLVATLMPARAAARTQPMQALRVD